MKFFKKKEHRENPAEFKCDIKKVEGMSKREYLEYYINVLESQIKQATQILKEKKKELKGLK